MNRSLAQFVAIIVGWEIIVVLMTGFLNPVLGTIFQLLLLGWLVYLVLSKSIGIVQQYEQVYVLRLGRAAGVREAGFFIAIWPIEIARRVNTQLFTSDLDPTSVLTSDAVSVTFQPSFQIQVEDAQAAALNVRNYLDATRDAVQGAVQHVVGGNTVTFLLEQRPTLNEQLLAEVEVSTSRFGVNVSSVYFRDLTVPDDTEKELSRAATARRAAEAQVEESRGELNAAQNLAEAARILNEQPGAFTLRGYQMVEKTAVQAQTHTVLFPYDIPARDAALASLSNGKTRDLVSPTNQPALSTTQIAPDSELAAAQSVAESGGEPESKPLEDGRKNTRNDGGLNRN
jgi:regulator of protease activity HflC (stomatin/prohibitin superfamily)